MKIVIVASRFPYPLEKGDKLRLYHQIVELSRYHELVLCAVTERKISRADLEALRPYCSRIECFYRSKWTIVKNLLLALFSSMPFQVAYFYDRSIKKQIGAVIRNEAPGHIYCQLIRTAAYVEGIDVPKTLDYMDNFSKWTRKLSKHNRFFPARWFFAREARRVAAYEGKVYPWFDGHTIISRQDASAFMFPEKLSIKCVPNGVDTIFFTPQPGTVRDFTVSFVGNLGYYNNVEAARYTALQIMPEIWKVRSDATLLLAGARPSSQVVQLEADRIEVSGWLDDIRDGYARSVIFVAPVFLAVGQQNKILEAMAMGLPCVTTPQVNNAIGAVDGESVLLADSAESFARQVILLAENEALRKKISGNGLSFVRKNFSWQSAVKPLLETIDRTTES